MKRCALLAVLLAVVMNPAVAADITPADAFNQGASFWGSAPAHKPDLTNATAADHLSADYYGAVPTATQGIDAAGLYGGGLGDLQTPGLARNTDCMAMVSNTDTREQMACDAVKTMNMSNTGGFVFSKNDPLFVRAKTAQNAPTAILSAAGMNMTIQDISCPGGSVALPTNTVTKTCTETITSSTGTCNASREVLIDHYANFQCKQSIDPYLTADCNKTLDVAVAVTTSCVPGTWNYGGTLSDGVTLDYWCDVDPASTHVKVRFTPWGLHGVCKLGYAELPRAPFVVPIQVMPKTETGSCWIEEGNTYCDTYKVVEPAVAHYIHNWKGACTVGAAVTYQANVQQGCINGSCTYAFRSPEIGAGTSSSPSTAFPMFYDTAGLRVIYSGPRWGNIYGGSVSFPEPKKIVTPTQTWINGCTVFESAMP